MSEQSKPKKNQGIFLVLGLAGIGVLITYVGLTLYPLQDDQIQISELPLAKLNNGTDILCKARNSMELCIYNETTRTNINPNGHLRLQDLKTGNKMDISVIIISNATNNYCIKEFHVDWKNYKETACETFKDFDKSKWQMSAIPDANSKDNLMAFTNNTQSQITTIFGDKI